MTYNLGLEAINLFKPYENTHVSNKTNPVTDEISTLTSHISKIQRLLTAISQDTEKSDSINYVDPEKRKLVDDVRAITLATTPDPSNPTKVEMWDGSKLVGPEGCYQWEGKPAIEHLMDRLNNQINRVISPLITQKSAQLTQYQYEYNEVIEVMSESIKICNRLMDRINNNISKGH